jgi:CubicO group peptidase (beta-lactamase class C family)
MKTHTKFLCCVLQVTISLSALAQTSPVVSPVKSGLAADRLVNIDRVLNEYVTRKEVAGGVALIARNGQIGYLKAFGKKDIESNQPMAADNIFRIASMTKAITIVAVMTLFEDGHFGLDEPISKFIPEFSDMYVMAIDSSMKTYSLEKARAPITIRHLLNHTSGLTYDLFGQPFIYELYRNNNIHNGLEAATGTVEEMVRRLAKLPLVNHPGEKWQYGLNMEVLAYMVERISGKSFDKYLNEKILIPLGMTDTYFFLPQEKISRLATLYGSGDNGQLERISGSVQNGFEHYADYETFAKVKTYFAGGGGLLSTASDYFKFLQMLLNGGTNNGNRILGRKTIDLMTSEQTNDMFNWWKGFGFGFGFAISRGPEHTGNPGDKGEYSWLGFYNTYFWVDPKENLIGIIMTQLHPSKTDISSRFKNLMYTALKD